MFLNHFCLEKYAVSNNLLLRIVIASSCESHKAALQSISSQPGFDHQGRLIRIISSTWATAIAKQATPSNCKNKGK